MKGLECCLGSNDCDVEPKEDCPYKGMCLCAMSLHLDVLALLKEQESEYEKGFNDAMLRKQELMYEDTDGKWHKKDW